VNVTDSGPVGLAIELIERGLLPDALVRLGIRRLLRRRLISEQAGSCEDRAARFEELLAACRTGPIAVQTDKANEQHYEVPAEFFLRVLGRHLKYSACHFGPGISSLDQAEADALRITCERADLRDGQRILELGCGWGSLSLWMAEHFPGSRITAVSNSASQRAFIETQAVERGLTGLTVVTADINHFTPADREPFDRVVSVEMFEHMRNCRLLLERISGWLAPGGRLFVHIFCHRDTPYFFQTDGASNWMGRYFFSGGTMPSDGLLAHFQDHLRLNRRWRWSGRHYEQTANAWLRNLDTARDQIMPVLEATYGRRDARRWLVRWRLFFMACAELFGYHGGEEWWVSHCLFEKPAE